MFRILYVIIFWCYLLHYHLCFIFFWLQMTETLLCNLVFGEVGDVDIAVSGYSNDVLGSSNSGRLNSWNQRSSQPTKAMYFLYCL